MCHRFTYCTVAENGKFILTSPMPDFCHVFYNINMVTSKLNLPPTKLCVWGKNSFLVYCKSNMQINPKLLMSFQRRCHEIHWVFTGLKSEIEPNPWQEHDHLHGHLAQWPVTKSSSLWRFPSTAHLHNYKTLSKSGSSQYVISKCKNTEWTEVEVSGIIWAWYWQPESPGQVKPCSLATW